ncbi:PREDICTED: tectonin beta-propeller repeat-containing protein 2 [Gekko japonicus]|uniref:Tectonin beta-propeller repeat-containing protein 2 n=1 Tax=Gekko japonicus TaxID=146911 RepID=A0ABM1KJU3_GEKJA|nr:PREDICTED: tectonin beta-propeller repeat-containing protein 2 [Gekko japonicus]
MASVTPSFTFKEFCPLYYLLNAIPTRIQKGFRSIVVYLTALDTNGDYIAVGSSIGMLYLYCRHLNQMKKYNFEGKSESITVVKLLSCFDDLVAVGTASGKIAVFQLVSSLPGRNKQLRRFDVSGIHKSSITALAWSPNGMKLYSGDDKGKIVYSALDFDQGRCNSSLVLEEPSSIVQLDYSQKVLLVSTLQRSLLFYTEEKSVKQVGTQPRKNTGKIGACFIPGLCKQSDLTLFAARPGIRLWKSNVHGTVQATYILKDVFAAGMKPFELYPRMEPADKGSYSFPERQFGLISCFFQEGWVLSWNEYSIYLLDTVNQALIGSLEGSGDIVSVSCTENEIFLLRGDRDIIRLSSRPEGLASIGIAVRCYVKPYTGLDGTMLIRYVSTQTRPTKTKQQNESFTSVKMAVFTHLITMEDYTQFLENGSRRNPSSLESTPCSEYQGFTDSPQSTNADSLSIASSLMSGVVDRSGMDSPDQESLDSQSVLGEENSPEIFSMLQSPELMAAPTPEGNGEAPELLKLSNGENEVGALPATDFSASVSPLLLPGDQGGGDETEQNRSLPPELAETKSKQPSQAEEDYSALCETVNQPGQQSIVDLLKDTETVNGMLENGISSSRVEESLGWETGAEPLPEQKSQQPLVYGVPPSPLNDLPAVSRDEPCHQEDALPGQDFREAFSPKCNTNTASEWISNDAGAEKSASSDEEDIYRHGLPYSSSETSVADAGGCLAPPEKTQASVEEGMLLKSDQFAESWMGYAGPGYGILSLVVSDKYIWCLDYKGGLYCSALPNAGLRWQKFEENVQQVAVSPSGTLLWKIEQKTNKAFACGKVTIKGKRHWYEALPQAAFVSLSDDTAWIIRTNGDFEMQALEPVCITLGDQQTLWVLDIYGNLWFRTGVASKKPQGDDSHWWQVSITDYVVFDQSSLFQSIIQATQTVATAAQAPVEKVADKLRTAFWSQQLQCQPSLLAVNSSGVWISSGKNEFHVAKGSLIGTYWNNVVPRGTASATKWAFVMASAAPSKEGSFLWLRQNNKDLFCVSDQNPQFHPSTVQLPLDAEMVHYSACQDAIWGLDYLGQVFIRTLSPTCPTGMHWTKLDLSQLGAVKLISLACGNQHIWACDSCGGVYFRVGTQPLNPSLMLPAWIMIEPPIQPVGVNLISIFSSPNDQSLWAIDSRWNVHVRTGITEEMPVGIDWEHIPGLQACQLAISTRTVWARCPNGDVARRYGITDKNPAGDYWKKIPGNVSCLTAAPLDELWATGASGQLLQRLTKNFHHSPSMQKHGDASVSFHSDDFEDEWEVI